MGEKCIQLLHFSVVLLVFYGNTHAVGVSSEAKIWCMEREKQALLQFKEDVVDDDGVLSSWGSEEDKRNCCKWRGIRCNNRTGHVTKIDLQTSFFGSSSQRLTGKISPSLLELQHLKYLNLGGNDFGGGNQIPVFIASFSRLQYLDLRGNSFYGPIPHQLGNLSNLRYLDLGFNLELDGGNIEWLSHLSLLRHLRLSEVNLSQATNWAETINSLPLLKNLHLPRCQLPNVVPPTHPFNSSLSLEVLNLFYNDLSSSIYSWLFNLSNSLVDVNLSFNQLKGLILDSFGNLISLVNLDLSWNRKLDGGNIEWLSHLSLLRHLDLGGVNLSQATNWAETINSLPLLKNLHLPFCKLPHVVPPAHPFNSSLSLEVLQLSGNDLSSSIDSWLFNLSNSLVDVDLSSNQLKGLIPDSFGNMISLVNLDLSWNQELDGGNIGLLSHLSLLTQLDLSYVNLTQATNWAETINSLPLLKYLHLRGCQLPNVVPPAHPFNSSLPLEFLDLSLNNLSSSIYSVLFNLSYSLVYVDLSSNQLKGLIPDSFGNMISLVKLDLGWNQLEGGIPKSFSNLSHLQTLFLQYNSLTEELPEFLKGNSLQVLNLEGNKLSGVIPESIGQCSSLTELFLANNSLNGTVPKSIGQLSKLVYLDISSNRFTGHVPRVPSNVTILSLSRNMFSGSISFICTSIVVQLRHLDLSNNQLSGGLPDCWERYEFLAIINLANNNFSGKLPNSMGSLNNLQALQLRNNSFHGELPTSLKNCERVLFIDLGQNRFTGKIKEWIGMHLTRLRVLSLRSNKFYGGIPETICHLNHIQVLDFSQNDLLGELPKCFDNFSSLVQNDDFGAQNRFFYWEYDGPGSIGYIYNGNALLQWKGQEREYTKTLPQLKIIDLSSNKFCGKIPKQVATLAELVSLNLSRNNLTGQIMQEIGQMKMLESLDLSGNRLSSEIPASLARLNYLNTLDLSNNNLSGKIPSSTQLQSFTAFAYSGNPQLCGLPLPNKCPGEEIVVKPHNKDTRSQEEEEEEEEEEDKFITPWFYISMGLGFAVGFVVVFGTILFNSSSRHVYFQFLDRIHNWLYVTTTLNIARLQRRLRR